MGKSDKRTDPVQTPHSLRNLQRRRFAAGSPGKERAATHCGSSTKRILGYESFGFLRFDFASARRFTWRKSTLRRIFGVCMHQSSATTGTLWMTVGRVVYRDFAFVCEVRFMICWARYLDV